MTNLVIYFSRAGENYLNGDIVNLKKGNAEVLVEYIQEFTDVDVFRVETVKEYPLDYMQTTEVAQEELDNNVRPQLKEELDDISMYDIIYIVAPNWWGTLPRAMFTQLEKLDFNGKTVKTLITHEGSGLGDSMNDIRKLCNGAEIHEGLAVAGGDVDGSKKIIEKWIE